MAIVTRNGLGTIVHLPGRGSSETFRESVKNLHSLVLVHVHSSSYHGMAFACHNLTIPAYIMYSSTVSAHIELPQALSLLNMCRL
jgi:hypothetical protein